MFHTLHRIYVVGWVALVVAALAWIYPRSGASEALLDWYAVWQNRPEFNAPAVGELSGKVVRVIDGASLTVQTPDQQWHNIGLLGLEAPARTRGLAESRLADRSKALLAELVLSNDVEVLLTWTDAHRRGVGVVRAGGTNVNAAMVETGLVRLQPQFIKNLPLRDQYALVRAERRAKQHRLQIAKDGATAPSLEVR
jgi:endonuclease YncB( thermonuclease family)